MSGFDGRPLVAGSVIGVRSWRAQPDGVLTGVYHQAEWFPGENVARCLNMFGQLRAREHGVATLECVCGFYAYTEVMPTSVVLFGGVDRVIGLVEGYGVATVGSLGFRCAKARIVAFVHSAEAGDSATSYWSWAVTRLAVWLGLLDEQPGGWVYRVPAAVRRRYPGVPVFTSIEAALAAFPLTAVEVPAVPDAERAS